MPIYKVQGPDEKIYKFEGPEGATPEQVESFAAQHFAQSKNLGLGNIDLTTRPSVNNADGSISTVRSMSFEEDGKEVLVPTVSDDGRILSENEAIDQYRKTGKFLGKFDSVDAANSYAEQLHKDQEKQYSKSQPMDASPTFWQSVKAGAEGLGGAMDALGAGWDQMTGDSEEQVVATEEFNKHKLKAGELLQGATDWREVLNADSIPEGAGKFLDYAKEQIGLNSPQMAAIMAGGFAGAAIAPNIPHPIAELVSKVGGFGVGATMAALPIFTGYNVSRQIDEGQEPNLPKAAALAVPQAAVEAVLGGVLAKTGLTKVGASIFGDAPGVAGTVAGKISEAIAVGVPGEVLQQALERASANLETNPFTSKEAADEYLDSAIAAAVQGGGFGGASGIYSGLSGIPKGVPEKTKKGLEEVIREDVIKAKAPKSSIISTVEEADAALRSNGFSPTAFPDDMKIKAANVMLDRVEDNRLGYQAMFSGVARENLLAHTQMNLKNSTGLTPTAPLKVKIQNKTPIGDVDLNKVIPNTEVESIAQVIAPNSPFLKPVKPTTFEGTAKTIPLEADGSVLAQKAQTRTKFRTNSLTPAAVPNEPSITSLPGQILEDQKVQEKKFKDLLRYTKPELIEIAKSKGIPETELADKKSNITRKKEDIAGAIMRKSYENPEVPPQPRVTPDQQPNSLTKTSPTPEVEVNNAAVRLQAKGAKAKKAKAVQAQVKQTIREMTPIKGKPVGQVYVESIDQNGNPTTPVDNVMEANLMSAAINFNDQSDFINLETPMMEVWNYLADKGTFDSAVVDSSVDLVVKNAGDLKGSLKEFAKTPEGRREIIANKFAEYAEAKRKGTKLPYTPKKLRKEFHKALKALKAVQTKMKANGVTSLDDLFDSTDMSANQAAANGVTNLRQARLNNMSDAMQESHWKVQEKDIENFADARVAEQKQMGKLGLYSRFVASATHLASKNPVMGIVFAVKRAMEDFQSQLLTKYREVGERWFSEPEAQVRFKAAEVLDHLRNTGQNIVFDSNGVLTFERDGNIVSISNPRMLGAFKDLDAANKRVLDDAEMSIRSALEQILPGAIKMSPAMLQKEAAKMFDNDQMSAKDRDFIQDRVADLEDIERMRSKAYVPHTRFGEFGFTVHLKDNISKSGKVKPGSKPVYHAQVEQGSYRGRFNPQQYKNVQKELEQYRDSDDYVVYDGFEMTYANINDKLGDAQLTFDLLSALLGSAKDEKAYNEIKSQLDRDVRFKGFARRFAPSENIPGYSKDWDRVLSSYFTSSAHYFAKQKYGPEFQRINSKVQNELGEFHKDIKKKVQDYVDYTTSPFDSFQEIRALNFIWTMGGNLSSAALQIMTLPTTTLGSMTQYLPNPIKNMGYISKNFKAAMSSMSNKNAYQLENGALVFKVDSEKFLETLRDKHKFTPKQIEFNKRMFKAGRTGAAFLEEQTGTYRYDTTEKFSFKDKTIGGKAKTSINNITNYLGIPISAMEQATRFATANAHYEMFSKNPEALKRAQEILATDYRFQAQRKVSGLPLIDDIVLFGMDEAHAVFGKTGRSDMLRGGMGAFLFPFMTYPMQAVEFITRMYGRGPEGKKALATTLGSLMLFAGFMGLPGAELLKEALEAAYKIIGEEDIDVEQLVREKLTEATGDPTAGLFVTNGIFRSLFNMDISKRIGMPIVGQDLLLAMLGVRGDMSELAGVQGSMATQAIEAWKAYNTDESAAKIGTMVTPMAISNLLKAYTYYDEGASTMKGKKLVTRDELRDEPMQILGRAMGVGSGTVADARDERYWATLENARYKPAMDKFKARGKNYRTKEEQAYIDGDKKAAEKWAKKYEGVVEDLQEYVAENEIPYDMTYFFTAVEEAVAQRLSGGVQFKELNKAAKPRYEKLKATSGRD